MDLLYYLPRDAIMQAYARAAGRELGGKGDSPESSSALVANAFGYFIEKPMLLPPLPGLEGAGWPAMSVALEANVRFPWAGGRHPWLDALVETRTHTIGIESKRFEPYRGRHDAQFSPAYERHVWLPTMRPYLQLMAQLRSGELQLHALDAAQLIKHALALSTQCGRTGKQPVLFYVYADPSSWPDGCAISDLQRKTHAAELRLFATKVAGAHVRFEAASYGQVLRTWLASTSEVMDHARALEGRFDVRSLTS